MRPTFHFETHVGSPVTLLANVLGWDGELITRARIESIRYRVYYYGGEASPQETIPSPSDPNGPIERFSGEWETIDVNSSVYDYPLGTRLNPNAKWVNDHKDNRLGGYNFEFRVPAHAFPYAGEYRIDVTFEEANLDGNGNVIPQTDTDHFRNQFKIIWEGPAHSSGLYIPDTLPITIAAANNTASASFAEVAI